MNRRAEPRPDQSPPDDLAFDPYAIVVDFYDQWAAHMGEEDVAFYAQEATRAEGPVVELGVGNGRVAIPVARAGQRVIGVDTSSAMVTDGRRRAHQAGVADRITWTIGDMRDWVAEPAVDLVMIPFRSFLHLTTTEDQLRALGSIHRSLAPSGGLILNMFVPDPEVIAQHQGQRRFQGEFMDERGRRCELWSVNRYSTTGQRLELRAIMEVCEGNRVVDSVEADLELRMVYRYEMEHLLARAGFEVEALYGWFDRRSLGEDDREMIWIARKA